MSTVTIPIVATIAMNLWGRAAGLVAALTLALNPFAISFAPTAFTDPLLVLAGMLAIQSSVSIPACARLSRQECLRYFAAGLWLGIAIMTKQQGLLYVPLVVGLLFLAKPFSLKRIAFFVLGLALITLPIVYWDSLRWAVAPSPWNLSVRNYGALMLAPMKEWLTRWSMWRDLLWYLAGSWMVWGTLFGAIAFQFGARILGTRIRHRDLSGSINLTDLFRAPSLLTLWTLAFILLHLIATIQPWDRYLLPLAPMGALLCGWVLGHGIPRRMRDRLSGDSAAAIPHTFTVGLVLWMLALSPPAWHAANGQIPIGGAHGGYDGLGEALADIQQLARKERLPVVLYHHVLGWQQQFYLFHEIRNGQVELRWFPHELHLATNAQKSPHLRKLLLAPEWSSHPRLSERLTMSGIRSHVLNQSGRFTLWELRHPTLHACVECVCRLPAAND